MDLSAIYFKEHDRHIGETAVMKGKEYHSFISADYYSLNNHPEVKRAAIAAVETYGTSLSVGQFSDRSPLIKQLESRLADVAHMQACCIFTSCYTANLGAISAIATLENVHFLYDQFCHASIISAIKNTKCSADAFAHNDMTSLYTLLQANEGKHNVVITEGLFSADGDFVDLPALAKLKQQFGFTLYVDEAHSFVISNSQSNVRRIFDNIDSSCIDIISGSLSKALCSTGGFVVASAKLMNRIRMSREYIFSTGITPSNIAASLACLDLLASTDRHSKLADNIAYFRDYAKEKNVNLGMSDTPSPVFTLYPKRSCTEAYQSLLQAGYLVQPLLHPAVPKSHERLRVLVNTAHERSQLKSLLEQISA